MNNMNLTETGQLVAFLSDSLESSSSANNASNVGKNYVGNLVCT